MPEFTIKSDEDLKKLEGWRIQDVEFLTAENRITFILSHPFIDKKVKFSVVPKAEIQITGGFVAWRLFLNVKTEDIEG